MADQHDLRNAHRAGDGPEIARTKRDGEVLGILRNGAPPMPAVVPGHEGVRRRGMPRQPAPEERRDPDAVAGDERPGPLSVRAPVKQCPVRRFRGADADDWAHFFSTILNSTRRFAALPALV